MASGPVLLTTGAAMVAEDLERYGESATAAWVLTCSEEELVRVCTVADWLLYNGPARASGASMLIAKACALAAVYVHEGRPRDLARSRRAPVTGPPPDSSWRRPDPRLHEAVALDYGVGADARAYWGSITKTASVAQRQTAPPRTQEPAQKPPRIRNPRSHPGQVVRLDHGGQALHLRLRSTSPRTLHHHAQRRCHGFAGAVDNHLQKRRAGLRHAQRWRRAPRDRSGDERAGPGIDTSALQPGHAQHLVDRIGSRCLLARLDLREGL
ncbi:hypothetical protein FHX39_001291 [Friedmanniella antarctica]|uniref:Uncharacterized protein n=1 Tax=Microlunatus antarcticus TaxID=53388 RepID=A0A7W5P6G5_9ACTN|nr:hypothetical protein [Microlunatus antarcticus]